MEGVSGALQRGIGRVGAFLAKHGPNAESEYRYVVLSFCVLLAALTLTWTGDTIFENIPLAMFAVGSAAWLYNKQASLYAMLRAQEHGEGREKENALSRVSSAVDASKASETGWRSLVRAPKVEESWETFASCIIQEFVYDMWYVFITNDVEFPAVVRVILNGAFGELALRGRALDIPSIISETCEVISEQLELFRTTREEVGPSFKHLSYAKRDYKLKQQLQKNHMLHPAVVNEKQKKQVLKVVFDVVSKILLSKQDASRPVLRIIVRELLANCVIEPLLVYFTPNSGNNLLLLALTAGSGEEGEKKEEEEKEEKPEKVGDIKWRAKQSENFENKTKSNPSIIYASGSQTPKAKKAARAKGEAEAPEGFKTIQEAEEEVSPSGARAEARRLAPSFSCRPVVKVLNAEEKFDKNMHGKKRFIVYTIRVKEGYKQWYIYRRYRNFSTLHKRMRIIPGYAFKLPPKRIFGFTHMSDQYVQNRCDGLNLYIHQVLHSSIWQCQEVCDFLSEGSEVYSIESREEENVIRRLGTDISEVSRSVGKKFEQTYQGFGNILANEYRRVGKTSGKVVNSVLFEWRSKKSSKKEEVRPSAKELSENVKLFQELKTMKREYSLAGKKMGEEGDPTGEEKNEDELIKEYLSEVTQELYLRTAVDNMTVPILGVIDSLFQLDTKDWLRRQVVGVTKQLFEVFVGSRVEKFLMSKIKSLCTEETVSGIIDSIVEALWPNGLWMAPPEVDEKGVPVMPEKPLQAWERKPSFSPTFRPSILQPRGEGLLTRHRSASRMTFSSMATVSENGAPSPAQAAAMAAAASFPPHASDPPNGPGLRRSSQSMSEGRLGDYTRIQRALSSIMPPEHIEIMNDEETVTRDKVKEALKDLNPPASISTLIGKRNFIQALEDVFDFVQSETMMNQLGHLILEIILVKEFPELESEYARIRKGDLKLQNPETEENV